MKTKIYIITFILLLIPFSVTHALITGNVSTDITGNINHTFSDGTSGYSYKDSAGYTHYQFNNGIYGNSYTDITGHTHYYFDELQKTKYVDGVCNYPTGFYCTEESQYQEMYQNKEKQLPISMTPEQREQAIMSSDPYIKICREHIELYKIAIASYDKCIQNENEKWQQQAKMELDLLKQQIDIERQKNELIKQTTEIKTQTCPIKAHTSKSGICVCDTGFVLDKNAENCVTCESLNPESFTKVYGEITGCVTCSDGYYLDKIKKTCIPIIEEKTEQKNKVLAPSPSITDKEKNINTASVQKNGKKINEQKPEIKVNVTSITTDTETQQLTATGTMGQPKMTTNEQPKKIGVFQKAGEKADSVMRGIFGFFKKISIKIKF